MSQGSINVFEIRKSVAFGTRAKMEAYLQVSEIINWQESTVLEEVLCQYL
jgi:hypothetical protein